MAKVAEKKKKTVSEFVDLIEEFPVIGLVNMMNIPTKQLQVMRARLREKDTVLKMTKKRLMKIAFDTAKKKDIKKLEEHFKGLPALIFTKDNPFKLYADLQKTKSTAPAKAGQEAPKEIKVSAGPTSFTPGPIIGQLGKYGIKSGVEGGKLVIKEDAVVAEEGDTIDSDLAGILTRLGIEPMEIGLTLVAVYEDGEIFPASVLDIDVDAYAGKIATIYSESLNLAVEIGYATEDSVKIMVSKAYTDARALATSEGIFTEDTAKDILRQAYSQALSLSSNLPEVSSDETEATEAQPEKEEPEEKPPQEEEEPKEEEKSEE